MESTVQLDPQARSVIDAFASMNLTPPHLLPIAEARAQFMQARAQFVAPAQDVASTRDVDIPGPAVRSESGSIVHWAAGRMNFFRL
jgi:hypothetical protein